MTYSELAEWCANTGFIPRHLKDKAAEAFANAYARKGSEAVERHIQIRAKRGNIGSLQALEMILGDISDLPTTDSNPKAEIPPMEISAEIELERQDYERIKFEWEEMARSWRRIFPEDAENIKAKTFTEPNDPRFDEHPSVFDGPYLDHPEYKANTYISVKREADAEGTSMHEICRRKNLIYEALIQ